MPKCFSFAPPWRLRKAGLAIVVSETGSLLQLLPPQHDLIVYQNSSSRSPPCRIFSCSSVAIARALPPSYTEPNSASWSLTRRCPREDESSAVLETQLGFLPSRTPPVLAFLRRILCCAQRFLEPAPSRGLFLPPFSLQIAACAVSHSRTFLACLYVKLA